MTTSILTLVIVGFFVGVLSGLLLLLAFLNGFIRSPGAKQLAAVGALITTIAVFGLGDKWFAQPLLEGIDPAEGRLAYLASFGLAFSLIAGRVIYRLVIRLGNLAGDLERSSND